MNSTVPALPSFTCVVCGEPADPLVCPRHQDEGNAMIAACDAGIPSDATSASLRAFDQLSEALFNGS